MPDDLHTIQHRADLAGDVARALGGAVRVSGGWRARCPVHNGSHPNLSVRNGDEVPLVVTCWSHGCDRRDILAELRRRGLLDDQRRERRRPEARRDWKSPRVVELKPEPDQDKLRWLLKRLLPIEGTPVATYLPGVRGVDLPPDGHHLRYLPANPSKYVWPCMVGIVTDLLDASRIMTLHFTRLKPDGSGKAPLEKNKQRSFLKHFPKKGGVIRLTDDAEVDTRLGLGEGIETCLHVHTQFRRAGWFMPVWSALDAGNLAALPALRGIGQLYIYADRGPAGEQAADQLAQRWLEETEAEVFIAPAPVDDWNSEAAS